MKINLEEIERNGLNYQILFCLEGQKEIYKTDLEKTDNKGEQAKLRCLINIKQTLIDNFKKREGIDKDLDYWDLLEILSD